jgi:hypothetical protein
MNLIDAFSAQLKAQTSWQSKKNEGTEFILEFEQGIVKDI